jgi:hypothetical protein
MVARLVASERSSRSGRMVGGGGDQRDCCAGRGPRAARYAEALQADAHGADVSRASGGRKGALHGGRETARGQVDDAVM